MARPALLILVWLIWPAGSKAFQVNDLDVARLAMQDQHWADAARHLTSRINAGGQALEARYLRGISYTQKGKFRTLQNRLEDTFGAAAQDFEFVLAHDSLYRDVLFQYGQLRRYAGDLTAAIALAETQVSLKPELAHAWVGLYQFYWRYILQTEPARARVWLRNHPWPLAQLFVGETYARQSLFQTAEEIFARAREDSRIRMPALLALARLHFACQEPEQGTLFMDEAIASLTSRTDALLLFDNIKNIVTPLEKAEFDQTTDVASYRRFFSVFWTKRNPMPAAPYNARAAEHYRRLRIAERYYLFQGFRTWYRSGFTAEADRFPSTYSLGSDFDDRGIIFLRHGEPDDYTTGDAHSWLYQDSLMIFHFAPTCVGNICSVTRHFTPIPRGATWSAKLVGLDDLDAESKSGAYLAAGLTTDRHRWQQGTSLIEIPYVAASFRGREGRTLVEVHYSIPVDALRLVLGELGDSLRLETGMTVHDLAWQRMGLFRQTKHLTGPYVGRFQVELPQEMYHVALHARSLQTQHVGAHKFDYQPLLFDAPGLKLSDILLADSVLDLRDREHATRDDVLLRVNPAGIFNIEAPVYVYFEIYDLERTPTTGSTYSLSYSIRPEDGEEAAVTLTAEEQQISETSLIEYVSIDVSDVSPGSYELMVAVRDVVGGTVVRRSRRLDLRRSR